nr:ATP-binding protein [Paenibacillus validus]
MFISILLFALLTSVSGYRPMAASNEYAGQANRGELSLSGYDWARGPYVRLEGEWEFYWGALLTPDQLHAGERPESSYIRVPGAWNGAAVNGGKASGSGYATYRLMVALDGQPRTYALKMPYVETAYTVWVNGELLGQVGQVGKDANGSQPKFSPRTLLIGSPGPTLELVVQVSNFHCFSGGMQDSPILGLPERIDAELQTNLSIETIMVGGLLAMGIHYMVLYLLRRKERESFYFGLFCLLVGIRAPFLEAGVIYYWMPNLDWLVGKKIESVCFFLSIPAIVMFVHLLYPQEVKRAAVRLMFGLGMTCTVLVFVLPVPWMTYMVPYFELATMVSGVYIVFCLAVALYRGREGATFVILGTAAYIAAVSVKKWFDPQYFHTGEVAFIGLFAGAMLASFVLSVRSTKAIASVESLSRQMREMNVGLEQKIRDRTAELERINRSLGQVNEDLARMETSRRHLLSNISHDLGTPMTLIQGYVEALMDGVVQQEQQQKYLKLIHNRITGLNRLIQDLFQLSKLEARQMEFDIHTVSTDELFRFFDERYELELAGGGLRFETASYILHPGDGRPALVKVDTNRIDQVLTNIIYNAVKHTPQGGLIQLHFIVDEHSLVVQVQDNGTGIAPEDLPYIFDRFYKKDKSRNTSGGGSGLGLAIAKEIVDFHGGRIWAQSRLGQGACIAFMLPLVK